MIVRRRPVGPEVSIVVPAHNEEDNLPKLVEEISESLDASGYWYEIIIIDDASSDNTLTVLRDMARKEFAARDSSHGTAERTILCFVGWF